MLAKFMEAQPDYRYIVAKDKASVYIYNFIELEELEEEEKLVYVYELNTFICNKNEITEEMVSNNLDYYATYIPFSEMSFEERQLDFNIDVDYRLSCIELGLI